MNLNSLEVDSQEAKARTNPHLQESRSKTQNISRANMMDIRENDMASGDIRSADWIPGSDMINAVLDKHANSSNEQLDFNSY